MFMTRKPKVPQISKECVIMHVPTKKLMTYDYATQTLYFDPKGFTVFPSKQKGISARHHAIETLRENGVEEDWKNYFQVIET